MRWIYGYVGENKKGLHELICIFSEYQKLLNLAKVPEFVPNELQTAFLISSPPIKVSGGPTVENADRVNMTVLPARRFSTT